MSLSKICCQRCGSFKGDESELEAHLRWHDTVDPEKQWIRNHVCEFCGFSTALFKKLRQHQFDEHSFSINEPSTCDLCKKTFLYKCQLSRHMSIHSNEKSIECKLCNTMFKRQEYLNTHMREIHFTGDKIYPCAFCKRTYTCRRRKEQHVRDYHTANQIFKCLKCTQTFINKRKRTEHWEKIHAKIFTCQICKKQFDRQNKLDYHIKSKH